MRVSNVIKKPILTEKSMGMEVDYGYVFEVDMHSSKGVIAKELKRVYGVDARVIKTAIMPGKKRRIIGTRRFTKTKKWKK